MMRRIREKRVIGKCSVCERILTEGDKVYSRRNFPFGRKSKSRRIFTCWQCKNGRAPKIVNVLKRKEVEYGKD